MQTATECAECAGDRSRFQVPNAVLIQCHAYIRRHRKRILTVAPAVNSWLTSAQRGLQTYGLSTNAGEQTQERHAWQMNLFGRPPHEGNRRHRHSCDDGCEARGRRGMFAIRRAVRSHTTKVPARVVRPAHSAPSKVSSCHLLRILKEDSIGTFSSQIACIDSVDVFL